MTNCKRFKLYPTMSTAVLMAGRRNGQRCRSRSSGMRRRVIISQ